MQYAKYNPISYLESITLFTIVSDKNKYLMNFILIMIRGNNFFKKRFKNRIMRFSCVILLLLYNWECWRFVSFLFGLFCSLCSWEFDLEWVHNKGTDNITCLLKILFILDKRKISVKNSQICGTNLVMAMACFCVACQLRMVFIVLKSCKKQNKECTIEIRCGLQSLKYLLFHDRKGRWTLI